MISDCSVGRAIDVPAVAEPLCSIGSRKASDEALLIRARILLLAEKYTTEPQQYSGNYGEVKAPIIVFCPHA
jgi:hypothetical protein